MPALEVFERHMFEIAVGVRVVKCAMLGKTFDIISALNLMKHCDIAVVSTSDDLTIFVEIEAPSIAPAFREEFEFFGNGVVAPDALLKFITSDFSGDSATLCAIKPAIWSPLKGVCVGMGILHAKTF